MGHQKRPSLGKYCLHSMLLLLLLVADIVCSTREILHLEKLKAIFVYMYLVPPLEAGGKNAAPHVIGSVQVPLLLTLPLVRSRSVVAGIGSLNIGSSIFCHSCQGQVDCGAVVVGHRKNLLMAGEVDAVLIPCLA